MKVHKIVETLYIEEMPSPIFVTQSGEILLPYMSPYKYQAKWKTLDKLIELVEQGAPGGTVEHIVKINDQVKEYLNSK